MQQNTKKQRPPRPGLPDPRPRFRWRYLLFFALGMLAALGADFLFPFISQGSASDAAHPGQVTTPAAPWGQLEYTTLKIERSDESFPEVIPDPDPFRWYFENYSEQALRELIQSCDFTPEQQSTLLDKSRWQQTSNVWQILPPLELVRDMSMSARKQVYGILKKSLLNTYMQDPCRFKAANLEQWLADSGLSPEKQEVFRRVVFHEGEWVYLYDGLLFEWLCRNPVERVRTAKALTQTETMLMKVRITPETDIDALLRYWGQGGRGKAMRPLLESLKEVPGGSSLNVSYFFPAFPRMRLYTYPDMRTDPSFAREDCTWTAINFFSEMPKPEFLKPDQVLARLYGDFFEVSTNLTFGDILVFQNKTVAVHLCVYVADNVVFTKNGKHPLAPWVLMKYADVLKEYSAHEPLEIRVFRRKPPLGNST